MNSILKIKSSVSLKGYFDRFIFLLCIVTLPIILVVFTNSISLSYFIAFLAYGIFKIFFFNHVYNSSQHDKVKIHRLYWLLKALERNKSECEICIKNINKIELSIKNIMFFMYFKKTLQNKIDFINSIEMDPSISNFKDLPYERFIQIQNIIYTPELKLIHEKAKRIHKVKTFFLIAFVDLMIVTLKVINHVRCLFMVRK